MKNDKKKRLQIQVFFLSLARSLFRVGGNVQSRNTARLLLSGKKGGKRRALDAWKTKERKRKERGNFFKEKKKRISSRVPLSPSPNPGVSSLSLPLSPPLSPSLSHRVLARPLAGRLLVPRPVRLVNVGDLRHQRVVRVRVAQQRADREEHLGERERGRPLLLEDVEADGALGVDVGVVDLGGRSFFFF